MQDQRNDEINALFNNLPLDEDEQEFINSENNKRPPSDLGL